MKFELYGSTGNYRWRLKSRNGKIIASGESYKRKRDCKNAIELIQCSQIAEVVMGAARKRAVSGWVQRRGLKRRRVKSSAKVWPA